MGMPDTKTRKTGGKTQPFPFFITAGHYSLKLNTSNPGVPQCRVHILRIGAMHRALPSKIRYSSSFLRKDRSVFVQKCRGLYAKMEKCEVFSNNCRIRTYSEDATFNYIESRSKRACWFHYRGASFARERKLTG